VGRDKNRWEEIERGEER